MFKHLCSNSFAVCCINKTCGFWKDQPVGENRWKYSGMTLTEDMSPELQNAIIEERKERKRVNSRAWHEQFISKGVS